MKIPVVCRCKWCNDYRTVIKIKETGTHEEAVAKMLELFNALSETQSELEYIQSVTNGNWPSCVEQLTFMLERAKEKQSLIVKE